MKSITIDEEYITKDIINKYRDYEEIILSNNVLCIDDYSFSSCYKLKRIYIGSNVNYISFNAFNGTNLENIYVDKANIYFNSGVNNNCLVYKLKLGHLIKYANLNKNESFSLEEVYDEVIINDSKCKKTIKVNSIEEYAFENAKNLKKISIPRQLGNFYNTTFKGCDNLNTLRIYNAIYDEVLNFIFMVNKENIYLPFTNLIIDDNVLSIGFGFNQILDNINNIKLSNNLQEINDMFFKYNKNIQEYFIPESINKIEKDTFMNNRIINIFGIKINTNDFIYLDNINNIRIIYLKNNSFIIKYNNELFRIDNKKYIDIRYYINYVVKLIKADESLNFKDTLLASLDSDDYIFNKALMDSADIYDLKVILENKSDTLKRFIKYGKFYNKTLGNLDDFIYYVKLLEKYNIKDIFLYDGVFIYIDKDYQELLCKYYNKNIKRLIFKHSSLLNSYMNFLYILGVFSSDKILSQKMSMFIYEKILKNNIDIKKFNKKENIDLEFINFFVSNYKELLLREKEHEGFIASVFNSFDNIKRTSTSNKGSQRHLLVTLDKVDNYFFIKDNISINNDILKFLFNYFTDYKEVIAIANKIINESKGIKKNIFDGEDLKEEGNEFNYEWITKDDYRNLVLGKLVECCSHILGHGAGIARSSMINNDVQTMVIKQYDKIIAKATIYVNKEKAYGVFNTIEIIENYRSDKYKRKIYDAFIRGVKAFVSRYNSTNEIKLSKINIGEHRNTLKDMFQKTNDILPTLDYSLYKYYYNDEVYGEYKGDAHKKQLKIEL